MTAAITTTGLTHLHHEGTPLWSFEDATPLRRPV